jgi:glycine dehydrogenase subunit 1
VTLNPSSLWSPADYASNAAFVPALGSAALELLAPQNGEFIVDLGCGDGVLTRRIMDAGARVIGLDASADMVEAARARGVDAFVGGRAGARPRRPGGALRQFDAAFSKAPCTGCSIQMPWRRGCSALEARRAVRRRDGRQGQHRGVARRHPRRAYRPRLPVPAEDPQWYPAVEEFLRLYACAGFVDIRPTSSRARRRCLRRRGWVKTFRSGWLDVARVALEDRGVVAAAIEARLSRCSRRRRKLDRRLRAPALLDAQTRLKPRKLKHMRYLPLAEADRREMLRTVGASSVEELFVDVPEAARLAAKVEGLPDHASEMSVERQLSAMARRNLAAGDAPFFLGCGAYKHHIPASVDHLIQRGEFLTSYTPYQPEIAQGTLQALFEFQTQVARLYGCDVANASMYDGSTACWEAIGMARRITRRTKASCRAASSALRLVAKTMAKFTGDTLETSLPELGAEPDTAQAPRRYRQRDELRRRPVPRHPRPHRRSFGTRRARACNGRAADRGRHRTRRARPAPPARGNGRGHRRRRRPGDRRRPELRRALCRAFRTRDKYVRQMPGRLAGETVDAEGKRGFVLTLSTREQHIPARSDVQHLHQFGAVRAGLSQST